MRPIEFGRLIYSQLMGRSTRVRVVQADVSVSPSERPVFVMSPYRSGTTLLRFVLDSHSRLASPPESDFLGRVSDLVNDEAAMQGLLYMGFDRDHVLRQLRTFSDYFFNNYARSRGKPRWVDKSPAYVPHATGIRELFPDAQFVVLHRHPLDQVNSFSRAGTSLHPVLEPFVAPDDRGDSRLAGARYWRATTARLLEIATWPEAFTLSYEALCLDPQETLGGLFHFLGEAWEPAVLEFNRTSHDFGKESVRIRGTNGFDLSTGAYREWDPRVRAECWQIVHDVAGQLGYSDE